MATVLPVSNSNPAVIYPDESKTGPPVLEALDTPTHKKQKEEFRNYVDSKRHAKVESFYHDQHIYQTYGFVSQMEAKYCKELNHFTMSIWECLLFLDSFIDDSDPDTNNSQLQHALQTAEAIRKVHPDKDWMIVTGLIHDLGKILSIACHEPQWAVVGDSFPVGCAFSSTSVFSQYFAQNPDSQHPVYSTEYGVYQPHCGLSAVKMSFGHDEYLYRVCTGNHGVSVPVEGLARIRFHSFYPWHTGGAYRHLTNEEDERLLTWVKEFNKFDLYSKDAKPVDVEAVKPYYQQLISKYFPEKLKW